MFEFSHPVFSSGSYFLLPVVVNAACCLPPALGVLLASHPRSGEDLKLGRLAVPFYPPTGWEGAIHWERKIEFLYLLGWGPYGTRLVGVGLNRVPFRDIWVRGLCRVVNEWIDISFLLIYIVGFLSLLAICFCLLGALYTGRRKNLCMMWRG